MTTRTDLARAAIVHVIVLTVIVVFVLASALAFGVLEP